MPGFGSGNPFPCEFGGGPSSCEQIYDLLKHAIGQGATAGENTIEADWRMAQARGLWAAFNADRAINQGFPNLATDFIPVWEELFFLVPGNLSDEERRNKIIDRWVRVIDASTPGVANDLQGIDPLFETVEVDHDTSRVTEHGRAFEDYDPNDSDACGPEFGGGRSSTEWPNYATDFLSVVKYNIAVGQLTNEAKRRIERAKAVLCEVLPAWVDFVIFVGEPGFVLDQDLLDVGAFGV